MPCYHPLTGYRSLRVNPSGKRSIVFNVNQGFRDLPLSLPCGRCIGCKLEYSRQWAVRLVHEKQLHNHSCFITLTYSPEKLPKYGSLKKKDFQDFMKRLRRWLNHKKIRFFHCGEYGEYTARPHYHAIIYGHDFSDKILKFTTARGDHVYTSSKLEELWTHGLCSIGEVTFESAAYVARYVTKKISGPPALDHYNNVNKETGEVLSERVPEYVTMSRRPGIGKAWFDKYTQDVFPRDEVVVRGKKMKPPKFYTAQYEVLYPEEFEILKRSRIAAGKKPEVLQHTTWDRLQVREIVQLEKFNKLLKRKLK